jgi:energy-coupling factor transporter ATP-binding protein EcfA2
MDKKKVVQQLIEKLDSFLRKYIFFSDPVYYSLCVLYILFTYVYKDFDELPYFLVSGPKGSGKSTLGAILKGLCHKGKKVSDLTPAILYRYIDERKQKGLSIIIDESEDLSQAKGSNLFLRVLRSGYKSDGSIGRFDKFKTTFFSTYCPKVIINTAGILDPALESRTIPIPMVRSQAKLEKFRSKKSEKEFESIRGLIQQFLNAYGRGILDHYNTFPGIEGLGGREEEIWCPILVIADILDGTSTKPSLSQNILELAKKVVDQRKRRLLVENRDAQVLESVWQYVTTKKPLNKEGLYVGDKLAKFTETRWDIPSLKTEAVSRILHRYGIIQEIKRPRLNAQGQISTKGTQKSCYLLNKEILEKLAREYL